MISPTSVFSTLLAIYVACVAALPRHHPSDLIKDRRASSVINSIKDATALDGSQQIRHGRIEGTADSDSRSQPGPLMRIPAVMKRQRRSRAVGTIHARFNADGTQQITTGSHNTSHPAAQDRSSDVKDFASSHDTVHPGLAVRAVTAQVDAGGTARMQSDAISVPKAAPQGIAVETIKQTSMVTETTAKKFLVAPASGILMTIGCLTTLTMITILTCVKSRMASPVPLVIDSARLDAVMQEAQERTENLKQELEQTCAELEALEAAGEPERIMQLELERDVVSAQHSKSREIQIEAVRRTEIPEKVRARAGCLGFTSAIDSTYEAQHFLDMTEKEAGESYGILPSEDESTTSRTLPNCLAEDEEGDSSMPPLEKLIRGATAPAQVLHMLAYNDWVWLLDLTIMIGMTTVLIADFKSQCADMLVWIWQYGSLALTGLDFVGRAWLIRRVSATAAELKDGMKKPKKATKAGSKNKLLDVMQYFRQGGNAYFDAYLTFQELESSWQSSFEFLQLLSLLSLGWGGFGLWICVRNAILDTFTCKVRSAAISLYVYSFLYSMVLVCAIVDNVTFSWPFGNSTPGKAISTPLPESAEDCDNHAFQAWPLCTSPFESVFRKYFSSSLASLEFEVRHDLADVTDQIRQKERKLVQTHRTRDRLAMLKGLLASRRRTARICPSGPTRKSPTTIPASLPRRFQELSDSDVEGF